MFFRIIRGLAWPELTLKFLKEKCINGECYFEQMISEHVRPFAIAKTGQWTIDRVGPFANGKTGQWTIVSLANEISEHVGQFYIAKTGQWTILALAYEANV